MINYNKLLVPDSEIPNKAAQDLVTNTEFNNYFKVLQTQGNNDAEALDAVVNRINEIDDDIAANIPDDSITSEKLQRQTITKDHLSLNLARAIPSGLQLARNAFYGAYGLYRSTTPEILSGVPGLTYMAAPEIGSVVQKHVNFTKYAATQSIIEELPSYTRYKHTWGAYASYYVTHEAPSTNVLVYSGYRWNNSWSDWQSYAYANMTGHSTNPLNLSFACEQEFNLTENMQTNGVTIDLSLVPNATAVCTVTLQKKLSNETYTLLAQGTITSISNVYDLTDAVALKLIYNYTQVIDITSHLKGYALGTPTVQLTAPAGVTSLNCQHQSGHPMTGLVIAYTSEAAYDITVTTSTGTVEVPLVKTNDNEYIHECSWGIPDEIANITLTPTSETSTLTKLLVVG